MIKTSKLDIFNNALALVGQGLTLTSLEETDRRELLICNRAYDRTIERALDKYNFSFMRKEEVINENYFLDELSLPWKYTYKLPDDVMRVLFLTPLCTSSFAERINNKLSISFNFRQIGGQLCLVTNQEVPFVLHYQGADFTNVNFPPTFTEALEYLLAGAIAPDIIKGTTGIQTSQTLVKTGLQLLDYSAMLDAQQGAQSIQAPLYSNSIVKSRF